EAPLFPGVFAIFGHGNVTGLGFALDEAREELPTIRGQNEQGMALAAVAYAKAMRRRQIMVATSSIGPGATNMVTAAGVAMANRLPVLLLSGDTLRAFVETHGLPVVETVAGKSSLPADHPCYVGPIGVTGCDHANRLAAEADTVLCVGTRLQDFTTGSWTVFGNESATLIGLTAARFGHAKHPAQPLVPDA